MAAQKDEVRGEIFNVAVGERYTLLELLDELNSILGTKIKPIFADERPGDIKHSLAAVTKAEKLLGYKTLVGFREGLEQTVAHFREVYNQNLLVNKRN